MASVNDIAEYITMNFVDISYYKLQSLLFYSEIWHITSTNEILFHSEFIKKDNGIFVKDFNCYLYDNFVMYDDIPNSHLENIGKSQFIILNDVLTVYGDLSDNDLNYLVRNEIAYRHLDMGVSVNAMKLHTLYAIKS